MAKPVKQLDVDPPNEGYLNPLWSIPGVVEEDKQTSQDRFKQQAVYDCLIDGAFTKVEMMRDSPDCRVMRSSNTTTVRITVDNMGRIKKIEVYPTWFAIIFMFLGLGFVIVTLAMMLYIGIKMGRRVDQTRLEVLRCCKKLTLNDMR